MIDLKFYTSTALFRRQKRFHLLPVGFIFTNYTAVYKHHPTTYYVSFDYYAYIYILYILTVVQYDIIMNIVDELF